MKITGLLIWFVLQN